MHIPATRDDLTPEWFTSILGLTENNHVETVDLQPLGESYSVSGAIYRARLTYSQKTRDSPESVVLKIPHQRSERTTWLLDAYRNEVEFYRALASNVGIPVPKHIYSCIDAETCDYVLVIEDYPNSTNVSDETGATNEQAYTLIEYMAKLHASYWLSPEIPRHKLLSIEYSINFLDACLLQCLPVFLSRLSQYIRPEELKIFRVLPEGFQKAVKPLFEAPRTLVHNDFAMKNILITHGSDKPSFVLVDWANVQWAPGVRDLSFFIMTSVPPSIRRKAEGVFLHYYWEKLKSEGVSDYPFKNMFSDYRRCVILDMARMVSFGGHEFFSPMYESILRHLIQGRTGSAKELDLYSLFD